MKRLYCFLLILYPYISISQLPNIKPLSIGDKLPDLSFTQIVNGKQSTSTLSQFKNKLLILDFWATWCSACIKKFSFLDSINQANENISVLLVTSEPAEKVQKLFKKISPANKPWQLPSVVNDTALRKIFPHRLLPHYVWLNSNFKVIAITGPEELTTQNISAAINGNLLLVNVKEDIFDFDRSRPLFINGNGGNGSRLKFRSTLSNYIPGLPPGGNTTKDSNGLITRILVTNSPVLQLLERAWHPRLSKAFFHFAFADSNSIIYANKDDAWITQNTYTYELILPPSKPADAYRCMQQDLQRYFSLAAKTETRSTFCYLLTADTTLLQQHLSPAGKAVNTLYDKTGRRLSNRGTGSLAGFLENTLGTPVIDETGFSRNISLSLPDGDISNINALQRSIAPYGLKLTPAQRMLSNFIIYQSN